MSYPAALLCIAIAALASAAVCLAVHRFVPVHSRERHHEVGTAVFLQLGVLFAVLLAFVFNEVYSEYGEAQRAIDLECGALHATAILASALPAPQSTDMLNLEKHYLDDVVRREWPDMQSRHPRSEVAARTMTELMRHAARLPTASASDTTVKAEMLALLAEAHTQREIRIYQSTNGLPLVIWVVLISIAQVLILFVAVAGVEHIGPLSAFAAIFAVCTTATLVLVRLLDYPFDGAIALPPEGFIATSHKVVELLARG